MPTKANGPLQEDYNRAIRAAKKFGVDIVRIEMGQFAIVIPLSHSQMERLARGHLPAPELSRGEPKLRGPQW